MTLDQLLSQFGVRAMSRQNDLGLVTIGEFKTYDEAQRFVVEVGAVAGCRLPAGYNPVHPPRETKPEFAYMNELSDREARFTVSVVIGEENPIFTRLNPVYTHSR